MFQPQWKWFEAWSQYRSLAQMPARSTPCSVMSDPATILSPTLRCLPSPMWTGKIRIQFMNSWRAGVLQLGQNSSLITSSTMSPSTKMTSGGVSKIDPSNKYFVNTFQVELWKVPCEPQGSTCTSLWRITWSFEACKYLQKCRFSFETPFLGSRYWRSFGAVSFWHMWGVSGACFLNQHSLKI